MPQEQKQIIRIISTIPIFSTVSFLCICFQKSVIYISPINDLYEAFAFAALFILLYTYVLEENQNRTFSGKDSQVPPIQRTAIQIFQFPALMFIVFLIQEISEATGTYCDTETKIYFAKLWCTILRMGSPAIAIVGLLRFYKSTKSLTSSRKPMSKLLALKGIVFLNFVQTTVFSFLTPHLSPTTKMATLDLTIGIPHLLLSLEMVISSIVFLKVYSVREYIVGGATYQGGFMGIKAIAEAANIIGFVGEMVREVMGKDERGTKVRNRSVNFHQTGSV
ncbi:hypothetical protein NHQ30_009311 [Ciborinia camelliae]|nr:hypothetical protein NHQ30_009311 [Ciborinia camelliae]